MSNRPGKKPVNTTNPEVNTPIPVGNQNPPDNQGQTQKKPNFFVRIYNAGKNAVEKVKATPVGKFAFGGLKLVAFGGACYGSYKLGQQNPEKKEEVIVTSGQVVEEAEPAETEAPVEETTAE